MSFQFLSFKLSSGYLFSPHHVNQGAVQKLTPQVTLYEPHTAEESLSRLCWHHNSLPPAFLHLVFLSFFPGFFVGNSMDSGMGLSTTIDKLRVFTNENLSTESLIIQLLIKRVDLSISIDSR